ncbi:MAG: hypothetical protein RL494_807 [Bacteroidota bacterium]
MHLVVNITLFFKKTSDYKVVNVTFVVKKTGKMSTTLRRTYVGSDGKLIVEEIVQDNIIEVPKKEKLTADTNNWIVIFQKALEKITTESDLTKGAYRLLLFLIAKTGITQDVRISIQDIAAILKENKGNVYRAIQELEDINVLIRDRQLKILRLNYELAYKGKFAEYKKLQYSDSAILIENKPELEIEFTPTPKLTPTLKKINMILEWAKDKKYFKNEFVLGVKEKYEQTGRLTAGQKNALDSIIKKHINQ